VAVLHGCARIAFAIPPVPGRRAHRAALAEDLPARMTSPVSERATPRRSGPHPAIGARTPSQGVSVISAPTAPTRPEGWLLAGPVGLAAIATTWLAINADRLDPTHILVGFAPVVIQFAAVLMALHTTSSQFLDVGTRRCWAFAAASQGMLIVAAVLSFFAWRNDDPATAGRILTLGAIASQPLLFTGLLQLASAPRSALDRTKFAFDVATIAGGGLLVIWYDLRRPLIDGVFMHPVDLVTAHAAAIGDLILLLTASILWRRTTSQSRSNVLVVLALGLLVYFIADIVAVVKLHQSGQRPLWLLAAAPAAACLVAGAAWLQRTTSGSLSQRPWPCCRGRSPASV